MLVCHRTSFYRYPPDSNVYTTLQIVASALPISLHAHASYTASANVSGDAQG